MKSYYTIKSEGHIIIQLPSFHLSKTPNFKRNNGHQICTNGWKQQHIHVTHKDPMNLNNYEKIRILRSTILPTVLMHLEYSPSHQRTKIH